MLGIIIGNQRVVARLSLHCVVVMAILGRVGVIKLSGCGMPRSGDLYGRLAFLRVLLSLSHLL